MTAQERLKKLVPVKEKVDLSQMSPKELAVVDSLSKLGPMVHRIYMKQVWSGNMELLKTLKASSDRDTLELFLLNGGPWDKYDEDVSFVPSIQIEKPLGSNVYPEDMTADEFRAWVAGLSEDEKEQAMGYYHAVSRDSNGQLRILPYSEMFKDELKQVTDVLEEALVHVSGDESLRKCLESRIHAFKTNQGYMQAERDWVSTDSDIQIYIGPFCEYQDKLLSLKGFFTACLYVRDVVSSPKIAKLSDFIRVIEDRLPLEDQHKRKDIITPNIIVANQVAQGGDGMLPTVIAFNAPRDEKIVSACGCKMVMLKNVYQAKYDFGTNMTPVVLTADQVPLQSFDAEFLVTLLHEFAHANGPQLVAGTEARIRDHLRAMHMDFEECKADTVALHTMPFLFQQHPEIVPDGVSLSNVYVSQVIRCITGVRTGLNEAHARARAMQINYFIANNAVVWEGSVYRVVLDKMADVVTALCKEVLEIQRFGDYERAQRFQNEYCRLDGNLKVVVDNLKNFPYSRPVIDIHSY